MNTKKSHLVLVAAGLAIVSPFVTAAERPEQQTQGGDLAYVGSNGRIGIGYDSNTKLRGEAYWVFSEDSLAAWIGEAWASGSAGGLKLNYHWAQDGAKGKPTSQSVRKIFAAVDQNTQHDQKLTLGGGVEQENLFFGAYVSTALTGRRAIGETVSTVSDTVFGTELDGRQYIQNIATTTYLHLYERPYDYGVGTRIGRYYSESLIRLSGGLDYEWGKDSSRQTTLSVMMEKFIANTPHSFSVNAEAYQKSGALEQNRNDQRLYLMYRHELGGKSHRPERPYRLVEAQIQPEAVTAQATAATVRPAAENAPEAEKQMVKTTATMLSDAFFELDKSQLTPEATAALDTVITTLRTAGYTGNIRLIGHTCDLGSDEHNQKLSEMRALSVKKYLVETGKLPDEVMIVEGKGETEPRYPNTKDSRPKNRRVDLEFISIAEKTVEAIAPFPEPTPEPAPEPKTAEPAKVEWVREYIDSEPAWLRRALHNTTTHKQSVDVYRQQDSEISVASGDKQYVNRAPVAQADAFTANRGETAMLDVLANDSDPDQDGLTITSVTLPAHGSASISGSKVSYTPAPGFIGQDTFSYTIADTEGASSSAQVTITVQAVNQLPVAMNDSYVVPSTRNTQLDVLANDRDPDGDALSIVSFTQPDTGSISQGNGNLVFTPEAAFLSTSFSYTISDGNGGAATATVTLIDP